MKYFLPAIFLALFLGSLLGLSKTQSSLSDEEKVTNNVLSVATEFSTTPSPTTSPSPTPTPITNHLVINEVYYDPDGNHLIGSEGQSEWVEIYNPTSNTVSLSGWSIKDNYSCDNLPGNPPLSAGGFAIIATTSETDFKTKWTIPSGTVFIQLTGAAIGNGLTNGDEISLRNAPCNTESIIDHISWGDNTNGLNPAIPRVSDGHSSERDPDGKDTDTAGDFVDRSTPTPGS